jgi:NDP-sugar pyrophosphorylase family protein
MKVANKPILAYQLEFLERNLVRDVTIITNRRYYSSVYDYVIGQFSG